MGVTDIQTIDGIAPTDSKDGLCLLLTDHLSWEDEYTHLITLQKKINSYIAYLENKQYESTFPDIEVKYAVIEIHFKYEITSKAEQFLQVVQDKVGSLGIEIKCYIDESK